VDETHEAGAEYIDHHFETWEQQHSTNLLGMWVFLATEVMFFGGMFLAYIIFRGIYSSAFAEAAQHQNVVAGSINTIVLILSSLMMVLAVRAAQLGQRKTAVFFLLATTALGMVFLGIKGFEYYQHWAEGLAPGVNYDFTRAPDANIQALFFWLYFAMTGVHAIHMIIGVALVMIVALRVFRGSFLRDRYTRVEQMGLYWHFVDVIWLFLFGLFYMIR
jgi:cytochrome c oxidase subunit III